ncbi:MAG: hypothetical protein AB1942_21160 [Pseudomonadota bacterium]
MAPVYARCRNCGFVFRSAFAMDSSQFPSMFISNAEQCPRCGGIAAIQDVVGGQVVGWRDVVQRVADVGRTASTADLQVFRDIATAAQSGEISAERASEWARNLGGSFGDIWDWVNRNAGALGLLVAVLTLIYTIRNDQGDDLKHEQLMERLDQGRPAHEQVVPDYTAPPVDPPAVTLPPRAPRYMTPEELKAWWNGTRKTD